MSSNSSEKDEQIDYDLDTSIVIKCKKTNKVFYNNVDNPLSISDLKKVNEIIEKDFPKKTVQETGEEQFEKSVDEKPFDLKKADKKDYYDITKRIGSNIQKGSRRGAEYIYCWKKK